MNINTQPVSLWARIRNKTYRFLWTKEIEKVDMERATFIQLNKDLREKQNEFEKYKASKTVTDMVRENLCGFDPKLVDTEDDLPEVLGEVENQNEFLTQVSTLKKNPAFEIIAKYLIRNQILYSSMEANTLEENNFGKATVNGIELFKEEVDRLALIYEDKHNRDDKKFDQFEVIS